MSADQQNLYEVLGLPQDASQDLIEQQCIHLGERYRSGKNSGDLHAALNFAQIAKAYETLANPVKRAAYDAELRNEAFAQDHAAVIASAENSSALTAAASGDISLHSKINSWIALLFLLVVCNVLSSLLSRIVAKWLQTNNFEAANVAIVGGATGVIAAFVVAVIFGRFLAGIIPLWPPLSGILMTRGASEITREKRIVVTVALLVLALVVQTGGNVAESQSKEAARIAAEETRRVAEATAKKAAEEKARVLEARLAEERARIMEAQARAAEDRARQAASRADAEDLARVEKLRAQCDAAGAVANRTGGFTAARLAIPICMQSERAVKDRLRYEALRSQDPAAAAKELEVQRTAREERRRNRPVITNCNAWAPGYATCISQ